MKKKKSVNRGKFNQDVYVKYIDFNKAVLWKDRELSVPRIVLMGMNAYNTQKMRFVDLDKKEVWIFNAPEVLAKGKWKRVGQEEQWYFPIDIASKRKVSQIE
jgi:hypothetical protein